MAKVSWLTWKLFPKERLVKDIVKRCDVPEDVVDKVFTTTFEVIKDRIMDGYTVQVENFGNFKLKHLKRRAIGMHYVSGRPAVSEEHLKIEFLAYVDLQRRAKRKLLRQKRKEEEAAKNADIEQTTEYTGEF